MVQRYTERFRATGTVSPFVQKNGPDRVLSNDDEAVLVQTTLDKPESCLNSLGAKFFL